MFGPLGPEAGRPALAQRQFNNLTPSLHLAMRCKRLFRVSPDFSQDTAAIPPASLVTEVPAPPHTAPPDPGSAPGLRKAQPPAPRPLLGAADWKIRDRSDRPPRLHLRERGAARPPPHPPSLPPGDTAGGWRRFRAAAPARGRRPRLGGGLSPGVGR